MHPRAGGTRPTPQGGSRRPLRATSPGAAPIALPDGPPLAAAYAVQEATLRLRLAGAEDLAGWKLAFNSAGSMAFNGLAEPCIAPIFRAGVVGDGAALRAVRPAIELMDHRGAFAARAPAGQAVAQGTRNIGAVLGPPCDPAVLDRREAVEMALYIDDARIGAVREAAPPEALEGLVWAAQTLAARAWPLRAGMILMCGTHLPVQALERPGAVRVTMSGLGEVGFSLV